MSLRKVLSLGCALAAVSCAAQQITVPTAPPPSAVSQGFRDGHFGVRFQVPPGWSLNRKDGLVSTFHNDARSASPKAKMRGVASLDFNPYPYSTLSGAMLYFSVTPHTSDAECARQAIPPEFASAAGAPAQMTGPAGGDPQPEGAPGEARGTSEGSQGTSDGSPVGGSAAFPTDVQDIGGMRFTHGHDEHGEICVEARDEVYTAYRKGACYRFDLEINTFCAISSGAREITDGQIRSLNQRMADILSTVELDWSKGGTHPVPAPEPPNVGERPAPKTGPRPMAQPKGTLAASL
ncbi:MAG TPA: hypothetical protein VHY48_00400 [Acidobacteriaceae bacterium]|jgi:hypothetical protein|nr:hypothetical protein [Acidobacteriaceae bacterium]